MPGFERVEEFSRRPDPSFSHVLKALTDALGRISMGGYVQEPLVRLGVLHNGSRLSLHRQHYGALALLELFQKLSRAAPECG